MGRFRSKAADNAAISRLENGDTVSKHTTTAAYDAPAFSTGPRPVIVAQEDVWGTYLEAHCRVDRCDNVSDGQTLAEARYAHEVHHNLHHAGKARHRATWLTSDVHTPTPDELEEMFK